MGKIKDLSPESQRIALRYINKHERQQRPQAQVLEEDVNFMVINLRGVEGKPSCHLLHYAVMKGITEFVRDLCNNDADVNMFDVLAAARPLQLASDYGRKTIAQILLGHGAEVNGVHIQHETHSITDIPSLMVKVKDQLRGRERNYDGTDRIIESRLRVQKS